MKRNGKTLRTLPAGDRRRLSDGRNAWRKMDDDQREEFLRWIGLRDDFQSANETRVTRNWIILDRSWDNEDVS